MPRFDGTGPMGQGPMTGRGMGNCNNGYRNGGGYGGGFGRGFGRGSGLRNWFGLSSRQPSKTEEIDDTKSYIKELEQELKDAQDYLKNAGSSK